MITMSYDDACYSHVPLRISPHQLEQCSEGFHRKEANGIIVLTEERWTDPGQVFSADSVLRQQRRMHQRSLFTDNFTLITPSSWSVSDDLNLYLILFKMLLKHKQEKLLYNFHISGMAWSISAGCLPQDL